MEKKIKTRVLTKDESMELIATMNLLLCRDVLRVSEENCGDIFAVQLKRAILEVLSGKKYSDITAEELVEFDKILESLPKNI